ncbi:MAG: hypothetical protein BWX58_01217 [Deltaproteobacteria bacterium ADurb.Bin026]|jgi:hypothetical protein|nr:MAG: hypothetical protein BWX58_01217 [Deltaproteobacteria bacterium ADurb.Bin026]
MILKLLLVNGKILWVDNIKAGVLQKVGKVHCVLGGYDENLPANNPIAKKTAPTMTVDVF